MLTIYESRKGALVARKGHPRIGDGAVWIDLLNPSKDEEELVEKALGHDIPTREELHQIEESSRLYQIDGTYVMTATVLYHSEQPHPTTTNITFILTSKHLVTIRYAKPRSFDMFQARCEKPESGVSTGLSALIVLLEVIVDRLADFIERIQAEVDGLGHTIFEMKGGTVTRQRRFDVILKSIGRQGEITSRARESLLSLGRLLAFLEQAATERKADKATLTHVRAVGRDIGSLSDHVGFQLDKITFLLDATLGMIQIEQNNIIKIVSVAAVVLLPPTLVASVYGMNFEHMPELAWVWGYPAALVLMLVFAVAPYLYFKRKGWL